MAAGITYDDKVQAQVSTQPTNKQWQSVDANEVKTVVNSHKDDIELIQEFLDVNTYIKQKSDFPDPVNGVISLSTSNKVYEIRGTIDLGNDRIVIDGDNIKLQGSYSSTDKIISDFSGSSLITSVNHGVDIEKLTLSSPNSSYILEVDGNGSQILSMKNVTLLLANDLIRVNDLNSVIIEGAALWSNFDNGILFEGDIPNVIVSKILMQSFTGVAIDLNGMTTKAIDISKNSVTTQSGATFLELALNGSNIVSDGEGSITANKIDDSSGGNAISGYDSFENQWAVALNTKNIITSDRLEPSGWGFYVDDESSNQTFSSTPSKLEINGLGTNSNESKLPKSIRGISSLWDTSDNCISPITEGDSYDIRILLEIVSSSSNPTRFDIKLDIGSNPDGTGSGNSIVIAQDSKTLKQGTPQTHIVNFPVFSATTFLNNCGSFWISANSGTITVQSRQILIVRTSSGAD